MQYTMADLENFIRRNYRLDGNVQISIEPYAYELAFTTLASGDTQTGTIQIQANADLVLTSPRFRCVQDSTDAALRDVVPEIKLLLTDSGSQQQLMNTGVDISTYFGQIGRAPYDLMYPRIISGRSAMVIQAQNYGTVTYERLELTFAGVLVKGFV